MVVALCLRGHGGSSAPDAGYSLAETTQDLMHVLRALSLDQVDLAGHSWGGKVATHFACTHPDRVRTLALADPVPPSGLNGVIRSAPFLITATLRAERGPFPNHDAWQAAGRGLIYLQHWDELDRKLWAEAFHRAEDGSYHHVLPESAFQEILHGPIADNILPRLSDLHAPVLLMRPTFTLSFLPAEHRPMQKLLPQLVKKRIPGDHTFIHTNPLDTAATLRSFLPQR
jgi:pimeloyl-ACP methyl ester carboxylesterase